MNYDYLSSGLGNSPQCRPSLSMSNRCTTKHTRRHGQGTRKQMQDMHAQRSCGNTTHTLTGTSALPRQTGQQKPTNGTGGKYSRCIPHAVQAPGQRHRSCCCRGLVLSLVRLRHELEHDLTCRIARSGRHLNTSKSGSRIRLKHASTRVRAAGQEKGRCLQIGSLAFRRPWLLLEGRAPSELRLPFFSRRSFQVQGLREVAWHCCVCPSQSTRKPRQGALAHRRQRRAAPRLGLDSCTRHFCQAVFSDQFFFNLRVFIKE